MYGHLDMLRLFLNSDKAHAIFCEDDILIRKDFGQILPSIFRDFVELRLDVLLLGCLCSNGEFRQYSNFPQLNTVHQSKFEYYKYDSNPESAVWGTQMYMLNRAQAKYLLDKYSRGYADVSLQNPSLVPFSADWTITKDGEKALIYPLVAIEDCSVDYSDEGQDHCRKKCYSLFYSEDLF
jgi:GR25 family glycosyltransferase involved in LPS biosynthesis